MLAGSSTQPFRSRLVAMAEAAFFLAVVVGVHAVGLSRLSRLQAPPAHSPVSIAVDLLAPPPLPQQYAERRSQPPQFVPIVPKQTPQEHRRREGSRPQVKEVTAAAVADAGPPAPGASVRPGAVEVPEASVLEAPPTPSSSVASKPGESGPIGDARVAQSPPRVPPRFDAPHLRNPRAEYPRLARRMGEEGRVMLRVFVSRAGTAEKVELESSSGSPRLDQAALEAVGRWKFVPARHGDEDVGAWLLVPIVFRLEG